MMLVSTSIKQSNKVLCFHYFCGEVSRFVNAEIYDNCNFIAGNSALVVSQHRMIQKLLQLQKKKHERKLSSSSFDQQKQDQFNNPNRHNKISVNDLGTIIQYQNDSERDGSVLQHSQSRVPAPHTDRATFNRNLMLLRARNKKSYIKKRSNYTDAELSHNFTGKKVKQISQKLIPVQLNTQNCFFITRNPQSLLSHRKCSLNTEHNLSSILPKCSKVHKIATIQRDLMRQITNQEGLVISEHCRRKTCSGYMTTITRKKNTKPKRLIQINKSVQKIDLREYRVKNEENWLSESIDISPWKYGHSRFHTDNT